MKISSLRIPAQRGHSFRSIVGTDSGTIVGSDSGTIVGSDSGSSWAPIPVPRGHLEGLMLEQLHTGQTLWPPLSLREETNIDVSREGLHASDQRSLTFNGRGPQPATAWPQSSSQPWRGWQIPGGGSANWSQLAFV